MNEVLKFFQDNPTFYLATIDGDQARVRPFGAVAEFEGKFYICTNNQKNVYQQLTANPQVEICGSVPDSSYVRLTATAVRDPRIEAKAAMLDQNEMLKSLYRADDPIYEVFYLKDATAVFCSLQGVQKEVKF